MTEMQEQLDSTIAMVMATLTDYGLSVVGAILILIAGWIAAGWVKSGIMKAASKHPRMDGTLAIFFASIARYLIIAFTVVAVLSRFGVETTSFVALLGAVGFAIGLALQGTLSNVASGVMLIAFRPFKIGDFVEAAGTAGTVREINLFTTELATPDNVQIIMPNSAVWGSTIKNFSANATRRVDIVFGIAYEDDIGAAMAAISEVTGADGRILADPEPFLAVSELADSSVNIVMRVWVNAADYWAVKFDTTRAVKERFDAKGISIPFPQRVVHMVGKD